MNEKLLELLEKIHSEIENLNSNLNEVKSELRNIKFEVKTLDQNNVKEFVNGIDNLVLSTNVIATKVFSTDSEVIRLKQELNKRD
jgi:peptidoglycan hydrolase CwlO-like protein